MEGSLQQLFVSIVSYEGRPIRYYPQSQGQWKKAKRQSGLSNVRCLHTVQKSLLEIAANSSSPEPQNSSYNLLIISIRCVIYSYKRALTMVIKQLTD